MSGLSPEDRCLLDLARDGHEPTESDRTRIRAVLLAGLGAGAGLGVTASATSAVGATAMVKVLAAIVVVGAVGGGSYVAYRAAETPPPMTTNLRATKTPPLMATNAMSNAVPTAPSQAAPMAPPREPLAMTEAPPPGPAERTLRAHPRAAIASATSVPAATPTLPEPAHRDGTAPAEVLPHRDEERAASPGPRTSVENEMRLVRAGVAALDIGDASRALALFDEHAHTYPRGVLAEERAGERVVALCLLNRPQDSRVAASMFLRDFPTSPLAARVRTPCRGESVTDEETHRH